MNIDINAIKVRAENARLLIGDLCCGKANWTMSIPADEDRDPDLIFARMHNDVIDLSAEVVRLTGGRDQRQETVAKWCAAAFGEGQASSLPQRGLRLAEEAIEAAQSAGTPRELLHKLIDFIYDQPPGTLWQELGGVGITSLALASAAGLSADGTERAELDRILAKPLEHFTARNQAKNDAGFLATPDGPVWVDDGLAVIDK